MKYLIQVHEAEDDDALTIVVQAEQVNVDRQFLALVQR